MHEQFLVAMAAGLAYEGKVPFIASYAMFCPGRAWEQVRTTMCLNETNVKIAGAHAGVSVGPDGATHQAIEDIAIMRPIPNMTVLVPCDATQTRKATLAVGRDARPRLPAFRAREVGGDHDRRHAVRDRQGPGVPRGQRRCADRLRDPRVQRADRGRRTSRDAGIECLVLNNHTIKPMDEGAVVAAARRCGTVVTIEEHQVAGGMGSRVAEILAANQPVPIEFVGVHDRFGQSGNPDELIEHYGMGVSAIKEAARRALRRKQDGAARHDAEILETVE